MKDPRDWDRRALEAYHRKDWAEAARAFAEAEKGYLEEGLVLLAAQARNNRAAVWIALDRAQEALEILDGLPDMFRQAGLSRGEALAWGNLGRALEVLGRYREAEEAYHRSRELLEADAQDSPEDLAAVYRGLARTAVGQGRLREGLRWMWKAATLHPTTALHKVLYYASRLGLHLFTK